MKLRSHSQSSRSRNRGVVLVVGLILLLVMTLIMIVAMSGSILQERMAGALRNESIADAGTDSALREGEQWLWRWIASNGTNLVGGDSAFAFNAFDTASATIPAKVTEYRGSNGWVDGGQPFGGGTSTVSYPVSDYFKMPTTPSFVVSALGDFGTAGGGTPCAESHCGPQGYGIEQLFYYRITARSSGGTAGVVRAAESSFSISMWTP